MPPGVGRGSGRWPGCAAWRCRWPGGCGVPAREAVTAPGTPQKRAGTLQSRPGPRGPNAAMLLDLFMRRLIRIGTLHLRYPDGTLRRYGGGPGPVAGMALRTPGAVRRMTTNPSLAAGELYMEGCWSP